MTDEKENPWAEQVETGFCRVGYGWNGEPAMTDDIVEAVAEFDRPISQIRQFGTNLQVLFMDGSESRLTHHKARGFLVPRRWRMPRYADGRLAIRALKDKP